MVRADFFFLDNELCQALNSAQKDSATGHEKNKCAIVCSMLGQKVQKGCGFFFILHKILLVCTQNVVNYLVLKDRQLYFFRYIKRKGINFFPFLSVKATFYQSFPCGSGRKVLTVSQLFMSKDAFMKVCSPCIETRNKK